MGSDTGLRKSA